MFNFTSITQWVSLLAINLAKVKNQDEFPLMVRLRESRHSCTAPVQLRFYVAETTTVNETDRPTPHGTLGLLGKQWAGIGIKQSKPLKAVSVAVE